MATFIIRSSLKSTDQQNFETNLPLNRYLPLFTTMKKLTLFSGIVAMVIATSIVFGQTNEGVVVYETKINLHRNIPKDREDMKAMIPEFSTVRFQLFFNQDESLFKQLIDEEDDMANFTSGGAGGGGGRMVMMRRAMQGEIYLNRNEDLVTTKQEFMGKEYLIEDSVKMSPWKFGTETKTIAGYTCRMAYYTDESRPDRKQEITAWFTDQLRPFLGPERFNTLPGAVMAVDVNNGERVVVAKSVELRALKKNDLKKPTAGTIITGKEFRKMMEERMKEMRGQGFMIRN